MGSKEEERRARVIKEEGEERRRSGEKGERGKR